MQKFATYRCIACYQPIPANAKACSRCGSPQRASAWNKVAGVLKWVGGFATVVSLVAGTLQLSSIVNDLDTKKRTVSRYVAAAKTQFDSGDRANAQLLLKKASELDPYGDSVRQLQVDFLLDEIGHFYFSDWEKDYLYRLDIGPDQTGARDARWLREANGKTALRTRMADSNANELLAVEAAISNGERKAAILAHIAWLDLLINGERSAAAIDGLFAQATAADPDNPFASVMNSAWLTQESNDRLSGHEKLALARNKFDRVRIPDNENLQLWFDAMRFEILRRIDSPEADLERIRLAIAAGHRPLFRAVADDILAAMVELLPKQESVGQADARRYDSLLLRSFALERLIGFGQRLGERIFGCRPGPDCDPAIPVYSKFNFFKLLGFLYRTNGQPALSLDSYRQLQQQYFRSGWESAQEIHDLLHGILAANKIAAVDAILVREDAYQGTLKKGDMILEIDGIRNISVRQSQEIMQNNANDWEYRFIVVRDGNLKKLQLNHRLRSIRDFVLPTEFVAAETTRRRRLELFRQWVGR